LSKRSRSDFSNVWAVCHSSRSVVRRWKRYVMTAPAPPSRIQISRKNPQSRVLARRRIRVRFLSETV